MTNYGHDLKFGTFITPTAQQPQFAVALAELTERSGLDLVTFQDHPYQPTFLDTWTLLAYAAAKTSRVSLSGNVLCLPLRGPAMLAKSATSLDLLSGGRFEMGLGAGAFWDAIAAMGGERLTPAESVRALDEAIQIIRGIWDADNRAALKVEGAHYFVNGVKRGPAPAHDIGIWLGAYRPKMLRLVGRAADGWLPSLSRMEPGALTEGNAVIDEAAAAVGRDPRAVRRLLNIGSTAEVERLVELALEDGISTFILATDEPEAIQRYGHEVAPAVRELVAEARSSAATPITASRGSLTATAPQPASDDHEDEYARLGVRLVPDDGVGLSPTAVWDESTRPHRAASGPEVTYSNQARQQGQHLVDVHNMLRSELTQVRDLVEQVREGSMEVGQARSVINAMTMRQNDWTLGAYCARYCTMVTSHHTREHVAIFPHLRAAEPGLAPVIDRLEAEHVVIHHTLERLDAGLIGLLREPGDFTMLDDALAYLVDAMNSHLAYEEREIVEPIARHGFYA